MKKLLSLFIGIAMLATAGFAFANAVATNVTGTTQVATGAAAPRPLRQGDIVRQGDTVITGVASSAVLKFDDGQITALSANSRLAITTYAYNPQAQTGNILLSLIDGGMRAVTGLIGRRSPSQVAYRAANATIGIRGTDVTIVTRQGNIVVSVETGLISYSFGGQTTTIQAGQGVFHAAGQAFPTPSSISGALARLDASMRGDLGILQNLGPIVRALITAAQTGTDQTVTASTPTTSGTSGSAGGGSSR